MEGGRHFINVVIGGLTELWWPVAAISRHPHMVIMHGFVHVAAW